MSVLDKVARERMGTSESPHIAHHQDWAEPKAASRPSAEETQRQWKEGLEQAAQGPRYAKRNMNLDGALQPGGSRYTNTADPARPKTPPFAWADDSGTVKTQELQKTHDTPENWRKKIEEAQSGPSFAKSQLLARHEDPGVPSSRSKHDVEKSRNILEQHDGKPQRASGDWAHTRVAKPAPYLAADPQWQNHEPMSSEFRHMGRATAVTAEESSRILEEARSVHRFAKKSGDYHIKTNSPAPRAPEPEPESRKATASMSRLNALAQPKSARGDAPTLRERVATRTAEPAAAPAAAASDADVYAQWKTHTPKKKKQPPQQSTPQQVRAEPRTETQPQRSSAPEEPVRHTKSPVRPEATAPVEPPQGTTAPTFERVGGRGGPKQNHAGANVFNSSWGFGAEHGDRDVSSADRFTSANRQMMQSGITHSPQPTRTGGRSKQAWGEPGAAPAQKPQQKIKYPVDDGKPWGVSANREAMESVAKAASKYEPPPPAKDRVRDHLGSTFSLGDEAQRAESDHARRATATRQAYQAPVAGPSAAPSPVMDRVRYMKLSLECCSAIACVVQVSPRFLS
jgi:hypothetical protein